MLFLVVALPRTGKSQFMVKTLLDAKGQGKRVFVTNFKQTAEQRQASGFEVYGDDTEWQCLEQDTWKGDVSGWITELPPGAVWMIDEAQDVFPQRSKNDQLPEWIKLLSKHGHRDLTIYIVTQDAMQLDVHVRRNSNITYYMTRPLNMSRALIYTFRGYQEIPNDAWRRSQVLKTAESKTKFKYSSKYQELYSSASAHEHVKVRLPWKIFIPVVLLALVALLLGYAWHRLKSQAKGATPTASIAAAVTGAAAPTAATLAADSQSNHVLTTDEYIARFTPRIKGVPVSAPAYDGFEVTDYPRLYCYTTTNDAGEDVCKCITQQGSRVNIELLQCLDYVQNGYFDPFRKDSPKSSSSDSSSNPDRDRGLSTTASASVSTAQPFGSSAAYGASGINAY